jgi:alcohol dehydrogenase class IV
MLPPVAVAPFRWQDGDRLVRFGRGAVADAPDLLGEGYVLLTTERALGAAPALRDRAGSVHLVPPGRVDEVAGGLRAGVSGDFLVAMGGGRVIDVAKALAAADPPRRVAAIPTTLSAAEMTTVHRHARGVGSDTPRVRPAIVVNDPDLSASQPPEALAASAANALGHAVEAALTTLANPVSTLAAHAGGRLLNQGLGATDPDRDRLALGALLAGYAIDGAGYGLHHVMSQTAVRVTGIGHGPGNAILLPHTLGALGRRFPESVDQLGVAFGADAISVAASFAGRTGAVRLRDVGVTAEQLAECATAAVERFELSLTPPPADRDELLALYEAAW